MFDGLFIVHWWLSCWKNNAIFWCNYFIIVCIIKCITLGVLIIQHLNHLRRIMTERNWRMISLRASPNIKGTLFLSESHSRNILLLQNKRKYLKKYFYSKHFTWSKKLCEACLKWLSEKTNIEEEIAVKDQTISSKWNRKRWEEFLTEVRI